MSIFDDSRCGEDQTPTEQEQQRMEMSHSPGPWKSETWDYSEADPPRQDLVIVNGKYRIAQVCCDFDENPYEVAKQKAQNNAHLIAAAPDLLEALQYLINTVQPSNDPVEGWFEVPLAKARAAIAKATE